MTAIIKTVTNIPIAAFPPADVPDFFFLAAWPGVVEEEPGEGDVELVVGVTGELEVGLIEFETDEVL